MATPESISSTRRARRPASPFQPLSFTTRDSSPRAASLARLAQSPLGTPHRSGSPTPSSVQAGFDFPAVQPDFRKIDPTGTYGSFGSRRGSSALSRQDWHPQDEDPEVIRKHLVSGFAKATTPPIIAQDASAINDNQPLSQEFTSLQLQGGDVTRPIYRFAEQSARRDSAHQRSHSFSHPARHDEERDTVQDIIVPGGFRRNFIQRAYTQPVIGDGGPTFVTRNFLHFLTLYGHFAGEDLEEWDEPVTSGPSFLDWIDP